MRAKLADWLSAAEGYGAGATPQALAMPVFPRVLKELKKSLEQAGIAEQFAKQISNLERLLADAEVKAEEPENNTPERAES